MSAVENITLNQSSHVQTRTASDFIPGLDGLRAIAILWVVLHNALAFDFGSGERIKVLSIIANAGWVGVQLFFVLSGFLITRNLIRTRENPNYFRAFYTRRALRILPLCYVFLFVSLVLVPFIWPDTEAGAPFQVGHIWLWAFLYNWSVPLGWPSFGIPHFWSLAVEEQFYLIWPFVVYRIRSSRLLMFCASLVLLAFCSRVLLRLFEANADMIYEFTICRMDALAIGAMIAVAMHTAHSRALIVTHAKWLLPLGTLLFSISAIATLAFSRDIATTQTIGQSLLALACGLFVLNAVIAQHSSSRSFDAFLGSVPMQTIGRLSFGMYVLHFPIARSMTGMASSLEAVLGPIYLPLWYLLVVAATLGAAWVSYHLLELPFLKMKGRIFSVQQSK